MKRHRAWFWFLIGLSTVLVGLLVGPRVPDKRQRELCVTNVHLPGPFGLTLICDFEEFLWSAADPSALLEPKNSRQSRPGLVLGAAIMALPLSPLRGLTARLGVGVQRADLDPGRLSNALASFLPAFVAYLLLNILFLAAAFGSLMKICGAADTGLETMIVIAGGLLLLGNDVVKVFLWSPHTQIFNILVPILGVYAALHAWSDGLRDRRYAVAMGAVIGLGFTAYPLFAVIVPCLALPALVRSLRLPWPEVRVRIVNVAIVMALSALPFAAWYLFVRLKTGGFYSSELAFGMVVWLKDPWTHGALATATALAQKAWHLVAMAAPQAIAVAVMFAWVLGVAILSGTRALLRPALQVVGAGLFVSALVLVFYTLVGMLVERVAYATVPPLIAIAAASGVAAAKRVSPRSGWLLAVGCLAIAIVQTLVTVIKVLHLPVLVPEHAAIP